MMYSKSSTDFRNSYHDNVRTDIFRFVDKDPGRILDVGGGTGATSALIKRNFGASFVALIEGVASKPKGEIDLLIRGDLNDVSIWDNPAILHEGFDTILCLDVLEHLIDPWATVKQCSKVLKPGGSLIISLPNARNYQLTFPLFFRGQFCLKNSGIMDRTHLRWFVRHTAIELATCGGLSLEVCVGGWYLNRASALERIASFGIAPGFLFQIYYLKARRPI